MRQVAVALQDVLVVTAPGSGAEVIPFLKTWVNLPMAIGFTVLYAKVCTTFALLADGSVFLLQSRKCTTSCQWNRRLT